MKILTKANIEQLANEIKIFLETYELAGDVSIYYNNKVERSKIANDGYSWEIINDVDPHNYFEWAAYNHILSMSFEGALYDSLNYSGYKADKFMEIFRKYGLYYELGNAWNLSCCLIDDDMEVEYTIYNKPKEAIKLYHYSDTKVPIELRHIMKCWYDLSEKVGDIGSCVIGAGFEFEWRGDKYKMSAQSPYQGSISWETHRDDIEKMLIDVGATDIYYNWGNMD